MRLFMMLALYLISFPILADELADYADSTLRTMANERTSAFVVSCEVEGRISTLLISVGSSSGLLIEHKGEIVVNLATIEIEKGVPVLRETHGGVYSYDRVESLIRFLFKQEFSYVSPDHLPTLLHHPASRCH